MIDDTFSHLDAEGKACMVDVSAKAETSRIAKAQAKVIINENTMRLLLEKALPKGDVLNTARIAGILAAKQTSSLIPLCHPLPIHYVDVDFVILEQENTLILTAEVRTTGKTGIEMEAIVAVQIAAATIYDMCKAVQKDILITDCKLIYKSGGKSGTFIND